MKVKRGNDKLRDHSNSAFIVNKHISKNVKLVFIISIVHVCNIYCVLQKEIRFSTKY